MQELRLRLCDTPHLKQFDITVSEVMGLDQVGLGIITQLTHLGLTSTKVPEKGWPALLPRLKSLHCASAARLPSAVFQYTGLTRLDIALWQGTTLPERVTSLQ